VINLLQKFDPEWRVQLVYPEVPFVAMNKQSCIDIPDLISIISQGTRAMLEMFLEEYIKLGRLFFYRSIPQSKNTL